ncbi:hypothetical protein AAG570_003768 [Ranatra chinensis]|uniref:Palmitoyltransferase n=1 Tax=Ranatra chinensis TaxID=642074 RepID=A0ABD0YRC6_9HEMI
MTVHCSYMLLPPKESLHGFMNTITFLMFSGLTLYNFLSAIFEGPGYLPLKWLPESARDETYLQFCKICQGYKAPRSHHCKKCGRCVLKMDHHCPWINNCVGHANHAHFTAFLFFSVCGSLQSTVVLSISLYKAIHKAWYITHGYENPIQFSVAFLVLCVFALGLAIGVVLAVGMLLFMQVRAIIRNRTGIEDWILDKAMYRRLPSDPPFIYPYDLGWWKNFIQVINFGFGPIGDGITWPVVEGCTQYTLTIEQKEQKDEKRARTRPFIVVKPYSGYWFPVIYGWRVCSHPPLTDEPRIALHCSEMVYVTRWRKYWLFGEKAFEGDDSRRIRGWFPRCCVVEVEQCKSSSGEVDGLMSKSNKKNQ